MAYFIGDKNGIEVRSRTADADKVYKIKGNDIEFIPEQYSLGNKAILGLKDQIKKSGFLQRVLRKKRLGRYRSTEL